MFQNSKSKQFVEKITLLEYVDRSINQGEISSSPSSGLKNCPTAIEVAGGGLPEMLWAPDSHQSHITPKIGLKYYIQKE